MYSRLLKFTSSLVHKQRSYVDPWTTGSSVPERLGTPQNVTEVERVIRWIDHVVILKAVWPMILLKILAVTAITST